MSQALDNKTVIVEVGQSVYAARRGDRGYVYGVDGEQRPRTVGELGGGYILHGGNAYFDIVYEDGTKSLRLPEAVLRSSDFAVFPEIVGQAKLQEMLAYAERIVQLSKIEADNKKVAFRANQDKVKADNPDLLLADKEPNELKRASKNIKTELKRLFPGVKFSVRSDRFAGGNSIDAEWTDGPTEKAVDKVVRKYQDRGFDGMTDCSYGVHTAWNSLFGGTSFAHTRRNNSDAAVAQAIVDVVAKYGGPADGTVLMVEDYQQGRYYSIFPASFGESMRGREDDYQTLIRERIYQTGTDIQGQEESDD